MTREPFPIAILLSDVVAVRAKQQSSACWLRRADFVCWAEWENEKTSVDVITALEGVLETVQVCRRLRAPARAVPSDNGGQGVNWKLGFRLHHLRLAGCHHVPPHLKARWRRFQRITWLHELNCSFHVLRCQLDGRLLSHFSCVCC